jgi:hypothetical protein
MRLTERQAQLLLHILQDTLKMNLVGFFSLSVNSRTALLNEILNQQDGTKLISLSEPLEPIDQPLDDQSDE